MTAARTLTLLQAGMIMSWLYACVSFMNLALVGKNLSFAYGLGCLALAWVITRFSSGRASRNYLVLILHTVGFAVALAASVHHIYYASYDFFSPSWVRAVWGHHTKREWAELILLACSVLTYWIAGRSLAHAKMAYRDVCARFDVGLGAFFALFFIELTIPEGPSITGSSAVYSLFSFLLLGILGIGVSLSISGEAHRYSSHRGVVGVVSSFSAFIVLAAASGMLFFLPAFERAAYFGYGVLGSTSLFIVEGMARVFAFLAGFRRIPPPQPPPADPGSIHHYSAAPTTVWERILWQVTRWGFEVVVVLIVAAAVLLLVFLIGRWLARKSKAFDVPAWQPSHKLSWWSRLIHLFLWFLSSVLPDRKDTPEAAVLYKGLLKWGSRSGLAAHATETPGEFGTRLCVYYPEVRNRIGSIVEAFNMETYGGITPKKTHLDSAKTDLENLRNPRYWPRRLKTRLALRGRETPEGKKPAS